jgi:hypothetical protein
MEKIEILGLYVGNTIADKNPLQQVLTQYGNVIRTRLGLTVTSGAHGVILLELSGDSKEIKNLKAALKNINGLQLQQMLFEA